MLIMLTGAQLVKIFRARRWASFRTTTIQPTSSSSVHLRSIYNVIFQSTFQSPNSTLQVFRLNMQRSEVMAVP
jgi:hypothetical protein